MLIDEVIAFARDYISKRSYRTTERKTKIREALIQLTGEKIDFGCSTCYIEALFKILNLTNMATPKGYELKKGYVAQFQDAYNGIKSFTNVTMTDELAEEYLRRYPARIVFFARYPALIIPAPESVPLSPAEEIIPPPEQVEETAQSIIEDVLGQKKEPKKPGRKPSKGKK